MLEVEAHLQKAFFGCLIKGKILKDGFSGRSGGQVVSMFAFNSDDPSSNPAEVYYFFQIVIEKDENTLKSGQGLTFY